MQSLLKTFELTGHSGQWPALIYWPEPDLAGPYAWNNTMVTKFPQADLASGRGLVTGPKENSSANGFVPVLISQTADDQKSWSTRVQVMACCLMAPSHYLNQCWPINHQWGALAFIWECYHNKICRYQSIRLNFLNRILTNDLISWLTPSICSTLAHLKYCEWNQDVISQTTLHLPQFGSSVLNKHLHTVEFGEIILTKLCKIIVWI